jgi:hypothetical protein
MDDIEAGEYNEEQVQRSRNYTLQCLEEVLPMSTPRSSFDWRTSSGYGVDAEEARREMERGLGGKGKGKECARNGDWV